MIPLLFPDTANTFTTYGIGTLKDAISCDVTKDGMLYELKMVYPISGIRYSDIADRYIIYAKPDQIDDPQPFRIYRVSKPLDGKVTVYARHISYDLTGIPVRNFTATSAKDFATKIKNNAVIACPFTFASNINKSAQLIVENPDVIRSLLGENDNTWQKVYGGELKFDGYSVNLLQAAGVERPVTIRYGVDVIDANVEDDFSEVYTGVLPFYSGSDDDGNDVKVIGDIQNATGTFNFSRIQPLDLSRYFDTVPSKGQVNSMAREWLADNDIQIPVINLTLSYAQIKQELQQYDTITVEIPKLGVSKKVKVVRTVFDVFKERYESVEVGDVRKRLSGELFDAARLKKGTLKSERIARGSIGGSKLGKGSVKTDNIANNAVNVMKVSNGAITNTKIEDGAVTGNKVLDKAIELAKLSQDLQVFYADTIAAINIVTRYLESDWLRIGNAAITNLSVGSKFTLNNAQYANGSKTVHMNYTDSYTLVSLSEEEHTGYDSHGASYTYYTYTLNVDPRSASRGADATISDILVKS